MRVKFAVGDRVIYTRDKYGPRPGRRAKNVFATPHGETYAYQVDKFWRVTQVEADGSLQLQTRRGKRHRVAPDDPRLRRARWWELLLYGRRFPSLAESLASHPPESSAPDSSAPDSSVPASSVPASSVPASSVPASSVPASSASVMTPGAKPNPPLADSAQSSAP
jgi:hypothetical protein